MGGRNKGKPRQRGESGKEGEGPQPNMQRGSPLLKCRVYDYTTRARSSKGELGETKCKRYGDRAGKGSWAHVEYITKPGNKKNGALGDWSYETKTKQTTRAKGSMRQPHDARGGRKAKPHQTKGKNGRVRVIQRRNGSHSSSVRKDNQRKPG